MKSAYLLSLLVILLPVSGCLSSEDEIGCPDNPPDGGACATEDYGHKMTAIGVDFSGMDLSGGNFTNGILVYANFSGADLGGADFDGANIRGANFSGADISGTSFVGAVYDSGTIWDGYLELGSGLIFFGPGADLDGANLDRMIPFSWSPAIDGLTEYGPYDFPEVGPVDLSDSSLVGASIRESWIWVADFSGSDLTAANLFGSDILFANFSNADLSEANLSEANLLWADLTGTDLTDAELFDVNFRFLRGCPSKLPEGWRCVSPEVPLESTHCPTEDEEYALLWEDYLDGLDMSNCNYLLIGPTLNFADGDLGYIDGFNLSGIELSVRPPEGISAVNLTGCPSSLFEGYICTGGTILGPKVRMYDVNLSGIDLSGADLSGALLMGVDLSDANLTDANLEGVITLDANFEGAVWSDTTCPDGTNSDDNGNTCENNL